MALAAAAATLAVALVVWLPPLGGNRGEGGWVDRSAAAGEKEWLESAGERLSKPAGSPAGLRNGVIATDGRSAATPETRLHDEVCLSCASLEQQLFELRMELRDARNDLHRLSVQCYETAFGPDTPIGAALRTPEARAMTNDQRSFFIQFMQDNFPIDLQASEVAWIVARIQANDWGDLGMGRGNPNKIVTMFLGAERILDQVSESWIRERMEEHDARSWTEQYGTPMPRFD